MKLKPLAIQELEQAMPYIALVLQQTGKGLTVEELKKNPKLQNTIIFCLKAIGVCVDNAMKIAKIKSKEMPAHLRNIHYLRNTLIHHIYKITMSDESLTILVNICNQFAQVNSCLNAIIKVKDSDAIGDPAQECPVLLYDFFNLDNKLKKEFPREDRGSIAQAEYLLIILNSINAIQSLVAGVTPSESGFKQLHKSNPVTFFALQNLLDLIATITNPNEEDSLLTKETRELINATHPQANDWIRQLGDDRDRALHENTMFSYRDMITNIKALINLKKHVLWQPTFASKFGIPLPPSSALVNPQIVSNNNNVPQVMESTQQMSTLAIQPEQPAPSTASLINTVKGRGRGWAPPPGIPPQQSSASEMQVGKGQPLGSQPQQNLATPTQTNLGRGRGEPLPVNSQTQPLSTGTPQQNTGRGRGWPSPPGRGMPVQPLSGSGRGRGNISGNPQIPDPDDNSPSTPGRGRGYKS